MSTRPAAIPLFGDAYLADTQHLTTEEHGAYLLLMMTAWRQDECSLPLDDRKLARIAGLSPRRWGQIRATILEFWTVEGGRIFQPRLRREWDYVRQKSESNRKSASARWDKQSAENVEDGGMRSQSEGNAPPPPPIEDTEEPSGSSSAEAPDPPVDDGPPDPTKIAFGRGLGVLMGAGYTETRARSAIGRWINQFGEGDVIAAFDRAEKCRPPPVDPMSFIAQQLHHGGRNGRSRQTANDEPTDPYAVAAAQRKAERAGVR